MDCCGQDHEGFAGLKAVYLVHNYKGAYQVLPEVSVPYLDLVRGLKRVSMEQMSGPPPLETPTGLLHSSAALLHNMFQEITGARS